MREDLHLGATSLPKEELIARRLGPILSFQPLSHADSICQLIAQKPELQHQSTYLNSEDIPRCDEVIPAGSLLACRMIISILISLYGEQLWKVM